MSPAASGGGPTSVGVADSTLVARPPARGRRPWAAGALPTRGFPAHWAGAGGPPGRAAAPGRTPRPSRRRRVRVQAPEGRSWATYGGRSGAGPGLGSPHVFSNWPFGGGRLCPSPGLRCRRGLHVQDGLPESCRAVECAGAHARRHARGGRGGGRTVPLRWPVHAATVHQTVPMPSTTHSVVNRPEPFKDSAPAWLKSARLGVQSKRPVSLCMRPLSWPTKKGSPESEEPLRSLLAARWPVRDHAVQQLGHCQVEGAGQLDQRAELHVTPGVLDSLDGFPVEPEVFEVVLLVWRYHRGGGPTPDWDRPPSKTSCARNAPAEWTGAEQAPGPEKHSQAPSRSAPALRRRVRARAS